jgi:hypothetical protein
VLTGDGAWGSGTAVREVFPITRERGCWSHNEVSIPAALRRPTHPAWLPMLHTAQQPQNSVPLPAALHADIPRLLSPRNRFAGPRDCLSSSPPCSATNTSKRRPPETDLLRTWSVPATASPWHVRRDAQRAYRRENAWRRRDRSAQRTALLPKPLCRRPMVSPAKGRTCMPGQWRTNSSTARIRSSCRRRPGFRPVQRNAPINPAWTVNAERRQRSARCYIAARDDGKFCYLPQATVCDADDV